MRRRVIRAESGFTLIEVMVAALILVIGAVALATVLINGQNESASTVQESQLINVADQQIEQVRAGVAESGFDALGLRFSAGFPAVSNAAVKRTFRDPDKFVPPGSTCFEIASDYDNVSVTGSSPYATAPTGFTPWGACGPLDVDAEPLQLLSTSGTLTPLISVSSTVGACPTGSTALVTPCTVTLTGGPTVTVYTFVTDTYECTTTSGTTATSCPPLSGGAVPTTCTLSSSTAGSTPCSDARRVTVAIVPNVNHALSRVTPIYLSSIFTNPTPSSSGSGTLGLGVHVSGL
jgi:prepilin-type N-terminal cleavage/methylation domain-containing protein